MGCSIHTFEGPFLYGRVEHSDIHKSVKSHSNKHSYNQGDVAIATATHHNKIQVSNMYTGKAVTQYIRDVPDEEHPPIPKGKLSRPLTDSLARWVTRRRRLICLGNLNGRLKGRRGRSESADLLLCCSQIRTQYGVLGSQTRCFG